MFNLVKSQYSHNIIDIEGYSLLLVKHEKMLNQEQLLLHDGFIIDTELPKIAENCIKKIRSNKSLNIALQPIFINSTLSLPKYVSIHTDGTISLNFAESYASRIATIKKKTNAIKPPKSQNYRELVKSKILAYCYTRNTSIKPTSTRASLIGYTFPLVSLLFKENEVLKLLNTLEDLEKNKLLAFCLNDKIHICKSCASNYLNIRECCPKCDSIDIEAHDIVHHFVCAHVAPEKDFKKEDGLECPKCDKKLRHIGIDYDKPSTIYSCNKCNHEFQNSNMKSKCIDCGEEHELDELLEKQIGDYTLTQIGENIVLGTKANTKVEIENGNYSLKLFKLLLKQEIKRVKINNTSSLFVIIKILNKHLRTLNSDVKNELRKEIHNIIKSYINDADVLSSKTYDCHYLLLTDTKENELTRLENIQYNLKKLLEDNLYQNTDNVEINYEKISPDKNVHDYLLL